MGASVEAMRSSRLLKAGYGLNSPDEQAEGGAALRVAPSAIESQD
ncbi:hypothetical protein [Methylomagnum sp.]